MRLIVINHLAALILFHKIRKISHFHVHILDVQK